MSIILEMRPQDAPKSWSEFVESSPAFGIAIDGYVVGGPKFDPTGPRANFNHHEEVDRLSTRATCAQVLMALRQGLGKRFRTKDGPQMVVFANDCDEDVCTTWFLLHNHHLSEHTMNPVLNRLVHMEDMLDATAGAYPFPADLPTLDALAWIFEPYRRAILSGELERRDPAAFTGVVTDVENRIMSHIMGRGGTTTLDTRYERVGGGPEWAMIKEIGTHAKTGAFADGISAYISVRERRDGRYGYVIGRMSPFINFPVGQILERLNQAEGITGADRWGGGDNIGGSPRVSGSSLAPEVVSKVVDEVLRGGT